MFSKSVNRILLLVTNVNLTGQTKSVYPDHECKPDLPHWTILHLMWQLQILPQSQMKSSRNFQHRTLRSRWIGTTSPRLRRHYATLPSGTSHGCPRHLRRLALLYKQKPKRSAPLALYKMGRAPLHLPTQASWRLSKEEIGPSRVLFLQWRHWEMRERHKKELGGLSPSHSEGMAG